MSAPTGPVGHTGEHADTVITFPYNDKVVTKEQKRMSPVVKFAIIAGILMIVAGVAVALALTTTKYSPVQYAGNFLYETPPFTPKEGYEAMWWDEFDTDGTVDRSKWNVANRSDDAYFTGNYQIQHYVDLPSTSNVENGKLNIIADNQGEVYIAKDRSNYNETYYTSARMSTNLTGGAWYPGMTADGSTWSSIYIEARLKAPKGPGVVGAFWLLPSELIPGCYSEIDIFETPMCNETSTGLWYESNTSTWYKKSGTTVRGEYDTQFCDEFVKYAIEWTPEYIVYYINDAKVFVTGRSAWYNSCGAGNPEGPYNRAMYIILNIAIGSTWGGLPPPSALPATMKVDYVRVSGIRDPVTPTVR